MSDPVNPFSTTDVGPQLPLEDTATSKVAESGQAEQDDAYSGAFCVVDQHGTVFLPCDDSQNSEVEHDFQPGSLIHERYLLTASLGRGGMGRVMLATDQLLHRKVAMKIVAVNLPGKKQSFQDALANEARLGASLNDRGIAVVHDFGIHAGKCFIIFEYVEGQPLRSVLRQRSKLPLAEVCSIISELARSLDYAHARGVVHRDLKPENICLAPDGQPKILDFGIARDLRADFRSEEFSGTPQYASPEQAACSVTDGRTDQYALGLLAYEMLSGRRVFQSRNPVELLRMHREVPPGNLATLCPELPAYSVAAVHRALSKEPSRRFATCQEFAAELRAEEPEVVSGSGFVTVPEEQQIDICLCHVADDSLDLRRIAGRLEEVGLSTWYYQRDALPGVSFVRQLTEAIKRSRAVLLLISPASLSSDYFASEVSEAAQRRRVIVPLLSGISREEFESRQPVWRPLLGASPTLELISKDYDAAVAEILARLASQGIAIPVQDETQSDSGASHASHFRSHGLQRQVWSTDSIQIDVQDLPQLVFRNPLVDEFLTRRNKHFLSGTKGLGKTLLLSYKRHLLSQSGGVDGGESSLCFVPQGRPYLDFMSELKSLSVRYESSLADLTTTKRFWNLAIRISAISNHPGCITPEEEDELEAFPVRFRRWLMGSRIEPTVVFKELTNLTVSQANSLLDDTETFLDQMLRRIHSATYFFIDKVDQAVRQLGREAWITVQAGLIEAAWEIMSANSHVKVYASIRHEAFANYESDVKTNLLGATTILRYSDDELESLMDRLTSCYESSSGFRDFLGMNVVQQERRSAPEDSFAFLRRHTFGRPRDLVVIASELSGQRESLSEPRYCEIVRQTSSNRLVANLFDEMRVFLDCLGDSDTRIRFLSTLPANVLSRDEAIAVSASFNGISQEMISDDGDQVAEIFHPFQDLYLAGLLAVVVTQQDSERIVQKFRGPDDLVGRTGSDLPNSPWYFLHPALSSFVRSLKRDSAFLHFQHVRVGDQLPWNAWDPACCQIERLARAITAPDLRQFVDIVIRQARDVLRSHSPRNLPVVLQSIPRWSESKARLLEAGHDELILWLDELMNFAV
ncbi:MAG: protein kinase [Planctomycetaceae bacterium]|nr:protein kinase [Planctomycetaceae bacterium]